MLINDAGVMPIGPFLEQSEQAIRSSIEVNLYGVIAGCPLALPDMIARRSSHIIDVASLSGLVPGTATRTSTATRVLDMS